MTWVHCQLLLFTVCLSTAGQVAFKQGMLKIGAFDFVAANIGPIFLQTASSVYIILGIILYVLSLCAWLMILSRVPLSIAYPMLSMSFVTNMIAAYALFDEPLSALKITGLLLILMGVYCLSRA